MKKIKGFSLIEVLMSLLIVSVVLVAMAPVVTKRITMKNKNYITYSYSDKNNTLKDDVCFTTSLAKGATTETYTSTRKCSEYTFTVPSGVDKIDLTLVGGGGGGGGAAGGYWNNDSASIVGTDRTLSGNAPSDQTLNRTLYPAKIKHFKINYMSSYGTNGQDFEHKYCLYGVHNCGAESGISSPAIVDFTVPDFLIGGNNFTPSLGTNYSNQKSTLTLSESDYQYNLKMGGTRPITWFIKKNFNVGCEIGKFDPDTQESTTTWVAEDGSDSRSGWLFTNCYVPARNYRQPYTQEYGDFIYNAIGGTSGAISYIYTYNGHILNGGAPHPTDAQALGYGKCGMGGVGASAIVSCPSGAECHASDATVSQHTPWTYGNPGCIYTSWTNEEPGGGGGGGAGGAMVKIKGIPVTPLATYTIRVGSGGDGGIGGTTGYSPTSGTAGTGGVSTALYDSSGNLMFMVNGGAQGLGGSYTTSVNSYGMIGQSGRIVPKLFTSSTYYSNTSNAVPKLDTTWVDYIKSGTSYVSNSTGAPSIAYNDATKLLKYPIFDQEPYKTIDINQNGKTVKDTGDYTHGGYSGFERGSVINTRSDTYVSGNYGDFGWDMREWSWNWRTNGFYFRKLINAKKTHAYIGGLGGFTGFGSKAGCGGYFNGDNTGCGADSSICKNEFIGTIFTGKAANETKIYRVSQYFEGCTTDQHNNGSTAHYTEPNPIKGEYGSGGTGGGGGGYSIKLGAGSGANGQNGFAIVEWVK